MPITRTIIPAAGFGTRMLPAAKSVPKEMLPVLDRPVIQYVLEEAANAGVNDALLITSREKRAIEDHFDRHAELEARLKQSGREALLASVENLMGRLKIHAIRQPEQRGLGDAVRWARSHVGNEPFLCQLGDTIFTGDCSPAQQLIEAHARLGTAILAVEEVPREKVSRYGIVGGREIAPGLVRVETLVEKPSPENAPGRLAIAARYVLTPAIFTCLDETPPGKGGEIQLTDALVRLMQREPLHAVVLKSRRHDIGNPVDWLATNLLLARRHPELWEKLKPTFDELNLRPSAEDAS